MSISRPVLLAASAAILFGPLCRAADYVWMIGGGPLPWNSQGQIELNVKWALEVIGRKNPDSIIRVFYTDGDEPGPDIVAYENKTPENSPMFPVARVFGDAEANAEIYYNHSIPGVEGGTRAGMLKENLAQDMSRLTGADTGLIIYNGHGSSDAADHGKNALNLWDNTFLDVYEFEELLSRADARTPMRFIMTQCYSGAFSRAVYTGAADDTLELEGNRCGFMAESAERQAEGCSGSLRIGEYRDYTTYFFAALNGKTRLNEKLRDDPDRNNDGKVTLREAHFYTLANAYSTDLSRSTSEEYLDRWQPWYTRWISGNSTAQNSVFSKLARESMVSNGMEQEFSGGVRRAVSYRRKLRDEYAMTVQENERLKERITSVRRAIRKDVLMRYPELQARATDAYVEMITGRLPEIRRAIINHSRYRELDGLYKETEESAARLLDSERRLAQVEKVFRLRQLATTEDYLARFGTLSDRAGYGRLVRCEDTTL
jgi:hypothetical protein